MITTKIYTAALLLFGLSLTAFGAAHKAGENMTTFQKTFLNQYTSETGKLVDLANEFSESGYAWRPAEGIRSVREVVLHVAAANYSLGRILGKDIPEGINPRTFEKSIQGKAEAIKTLEKSLDFAKEAVRSLDETGLNEEIKLFGQDSNKMGAVMVLGGHAYEHLGQLIAYARSTDVVPPWSR